MAAIFPDDIFKYIFVNENIWISIKMKFVPHGTINNIPALVQIIAWRLPGNKPAFTNMDTASVNVYTSLVSYDNSIV